MEIADIISLIIATGALSFSVYNYFTARTINMYQDLDGLYLELLKLGITYPAFVNPKLTRDYKKSFAGDQLLQYELFAFMVWNVCETIHDRKSIKGFFKTWKCIITVENEIHRSWFDSEDNHCRFKPEFIDYVNGLPKQKKESK